MNMVFLNPKNETLLVFFEFLRHQAIYGVHGLALSEFSDLQKSVGLIFEKRNLVQLWSGISHEMNILASVSPDSS